MRKGKEIDMGGFTMGWGRATFDSEYPNYLDGSLWFIVPVYLFCPTGVCPRKKVLFFTFVSFWCKYQLPLPGNSIS